MSNWRYTSKAAMAFIAAVGMSSSAALAGESTDENSTPEISPANTAASLSGGDISETGQVVFPGYNTIATSAQISNEDENLRLDVGLDWNIGNTPKVVEIGDIEFIGADVWNASFRGSLPLNSTKADDFVSFDTFGIDGKVSFGIDYLSVSYPSSIYLEEPFDRLAEQCIVLASQEWIQRPNTISRELREEFVYEFVEAVVLNLRDITDLRAWDAKLDSFVAIYASSAEAQDEAIEKLAEEFEKRELDQDKLIGLIRNSKGNNPFASVANEECGRYEKEKNPKGNKIIGNFNAIVSYFEKSHPDDPIYREFLDSIPSGSAIFAGIEGSAGLNRFNFVQSAPFLEDEVDRVGFDFNMHAGKLFNRGNTAVRIGGGYTRVFKAQEETTLCETDAATMVESCITGQNGLPERMDTGYVEFGLRHILKRTASDKPMLAIAPSVTYIVEEKDFQFRLPFFLQRSEEGGLDVGVQAIYNNADKDFGVGAFVGIPFTLTSR